MRIRRLGDTELELTAIGLGTWAIGGPWEYGWGPQDDNDSVAAIRAALDCGINWIDTAPAYGCGHSEEVVGRAIKDAGHKPYIATKCGILWDDQRRKVLCLNRDSIISECEASLKRLGVEVIDLYHMHWPDPDEQVEEAFEAMALMAKQGKVRYLGVSNFSVSQIRRAEPIHPVSSLQPPYNMIKRQAEEELLPYCRENNIGIVAYSPMHRGLLAGAFSVERVANLAPDDHRRSVADFCPPQLNINLELIDKLKAIAKRSGRTVAQLAIAWVLRRDEVTSAIVGARNERQITETVAAGDWELGADDIAEIETYLEDRSIRLSELSL